jgi:hypothetical protein
MLIVSAVLFVLLGPFLQASSSASGWKPDVSVPPPVSPPTQPTPFALRRLDESESVTGPMAVSVAPQFMQSRVLPTPSAFPFMVASALGPNGNRLAIMCANTQAVHEPSVNGGRNVRIEVYTKTLDSVDFLYAFPIGQVSLDVTYPTQGQLMFVGEDYLAYSHKTEQTTLLYIHHIQRLSDQPIATMDTERTPIFRHTGTNTIDKVAIQTTDESGFRYQWLYIDGVLSAPFHTGPRLTSMCATIGVTAGGWGTENSVRVYRATAGQSTWIHDSSFNTASWNFHSNNGDDTEMAQLLNNGTVMVLLHRGGIGFDACFIAVTINLTTYQFGPPVIAFNLSTDAYTVSDLTDRPQTWMYGQEGGSLFATGRNRRNAHYEWGERQEDNDHRLYHISGTTIVNVATFSQGDTGNPASAVIGDNFVVTPPEFDFLLPYTHDSHIRTNEFGQIDILMQESTRELTGGTYTGIVFSHRVIPIF